MNFKHLFILFLAVSFSAKAQIDLTMPVNRMVYQRNQLNTANIYIGGSFSSQLDRIEARLTKLDGAGVPKTPLEQSGWLNIVNNPQNGNFLGSINNQKAGWYQLEVRALQNNAQIGNISTIKVGIGEVIVVAGQSNAVGDVPARDKTLYGAKDDRVNCVNMNDLNLGTKYTYPVVSHMEPSSLIAPGGGSSWCWGPLGDLITKNWDVPVIFFNAAYGNTSIFQWRASANNEYEPIGNLDTISGVPFIHLKKTLNYYCSLMGVRTILWCQGENDNGAFGNGTSSVIYRLNLQQVIEKSRAVTDKNISWIVAKTSFNGSQTNSNVTQGQQLTIDLPNFNVFAGPNTDAIQPSYFERDFGGVHFWGPGLIDLSYAWFYSMNDTGFLGNSKPYPASPPQPLSLSNCVNNNTITATMPNGFTEYSWNTDNYAITATSQSISAVGSKFLVPNMRDGANKNFIFSPPINFTPAKLELKTDRSSTICQGDTLHVIANTFNNNYNWSTGANTKTINIKDEGNYNITLSSKDVYGCSASVSATYNVKINQLPPSPNIIAESPSSICQGSTVFLKPVVEQSLYENVWSNGVKVARVPINTSGNYTLAYKDKNNCNSLPSNKIEVVVHPNPEKPDIIAGGPTEFCADKFVTIATSPEANFEWQLNNEKVPEFKTQFVNATLPGVYTAKVITQFGCISPASNQIKVNTWALPEAPFITKSGATAFCAGNEVELKANSSLTNLMWSTDSKENFSTDSKILITSQYESKANSNTTYFARVTDARGCTSVPSEKVLVSVRANPSVPRIDAVGTFTLQSKPPILGLDGDIFDWYFQDKTLSPKTKDIKINEAGNYSVKAKIDYKLPNNSNLVCFSQASPLYYYSNPLNTLFSIYPNPTKTGKVTLETKDDLTNAQLTLYTILGQQIMSQSVDLFNERKELDLSALPNGEYKLKLQNGNFIITKSLIISK